MADFCMSCSVSTFGSDFGDLKGLSKPEDTENGLYPCVLCECCGAIQVDHDGKRVSKEWDKSCRC